MNLLNSFEARASYVKRKVNVYFALAMSESQEFLLGHIWLNMNPCNISFRQLQLLQNPANSIKKNTVRMAKVRNLAVHGVYAYGSYSFAYGHYFAANYIYVDGRR